MIDFVVELYVVPAILDIITVTVPSLSLLRC